VVPLMRPSTRKLSPGGFRALEVASIIMLCLAAACLVAAVVVFCDAVATPLPQSGSSEESLGDGVAAGVMIAMVCPGILAVGTLFLLTGIFGVRGGRSARRGRGDLCDVLIMDIVIIGLLVAFCVVYILTLRFGSDAENLSKGIGFVALCIAPVIALEGAHLVTAIVARGTRADAASSDR